MNGIVVLDKPEGRTSFQAARAVGRAFGREKTGHAGTLDPMATGVLPIMVGRATKLLQFLPETGKEYIAEALFGIRTDTADADGAVLETGGRIPSEEEFRGSLQSFLGKSEQIPPMYSAIKQNGVPLYELAREGIAVDRAPRKIEVYEAELLSFGAERAVFRVSCSAGTYIRTLAEDAAARCGAVCHLTSLRRTAACGFGIDEAVTLDALLEAAAAGDTGRYLISPEKVFGIYPDVHLDRNLKRLFLNGFDFEQSRAGTELPPSSLIRVYDGTEMIGIAEITASGTLHKLWQSETVN